ncbi:muscular LMNA-interacting protein isoform X3 [Echinops telfairi]|uniref:Muscular LMNA-interacting protein isoform X3 n=1 Tax=Echinops telfairi TaxID=9371 RepID=A0AC55DGE1_ECHTE|nr:muscular LMNA-interacting protein isoform X3 [Echinops telfairi]
MAPEDWNILAGLFCRLVSSGESEAKPLIFTFVPTVRRLPTHFQLADASKFLVKIPEESSNKNAETINRPNSNDYLTFNTGRQQQTVEGTFTYPLESRGKLSKGRALKGNKSQGMQQSDLFKAEYVFIVDSEGEDEGPSRRGDQGSPVQKGSGAVRPKSLAISSGLVSDVVRPKTRGPNLQTSSLSETPHGLAPQQKHGQFTSSPTTSEQLARKPPAFSFVSATNEKAQPDPVNRGCTSVLEELHTRRLDDGSGVLMEETATYFQTTAHSLPSLASKGISSPLSFPPSTQLPGSDLSRPRAADQKWMPEALKKTTLLTSQVLGARGSLIPSSPSPSSDTSPKRNPASYIPVRIITHSLSPSPKPFTSSLHGSSSTLCSQISSSGNLTKLGGKPPVPSRLSLLTAILKSTPSHQRPFSPASCPTFSLNSLASSTLTLDQKVKETPPTPKKSLSSCCLSTGTEQGGHQVSESTQQSFQLPIFTKSTPLSLTPSLSPIKPTRGSPILSRAEKTLSPTSLKSNAAPSLLPTDLLSSAKRFPAPPSASPLSPSKSKEDANIRDLEVPRPHTHPSTPASTASSSLSSPTTRRATQYSAEKSFQPSPALSNMINRSKSAESQLFGPLQKPAASSAPPISSSSSASLPNLGSLPLPPANLPGQALQLSSSAVHPICGGRTLPSRPGSSQSTVSGHTLWVATPSPPISFPRTKELISPCALSMPTDPEKRKPKQYKTKSSYKAFAAIPTNIFLLEQKALDEPAKNESVSQDNSGDAPWEFCFPAQLRQQTEELCATIDKVLQDSLSMYSSESPSRSPQTLGSDTIKIPTTLPRAAGRETKYANLSSPSSAISESQLTKPGVIRPVPVKSKIFLKREEEVFEPNPFSKYLEDESNLFPDQDVTVPHKTVSLHPLYQTKLYPPAKSLLHPQNLPHADCLTPGPFSHLSSFSLSDEQNSHTLFSHNAYNKPSHPMVAIPEHETLDSKEK